MVFQLQKIIIFPKPFKGAFAQLREQNPRYPTKVWNIKFGPGQLVPGTVVRAGNVVPVLQLNVISMLKKIWAKNIVSKKSYVENTFSRCFQKYLGKF